MQPQTPSVLREARRSHSEVGSGGDHHEPQEIRSTTKALV